MAELMDTSGVLLSQNTKWTINTAFALESKYFNPKAVGPKTLRR